VVLKVQDARRSVPRVKIRQSALSHGLSRSLKVPDYCADPLQISLNRDESRSRESPSMRSISGITVPRLVEKGTTEKRSVAYHQVSIFVTFCYGRTEPTHSHSV